MKVTWDELMTPPDDVPNWFSRIVRSIKVADHLGDVWDALIAYGPSDEAKKWIKIVASAEYVEDDEMDPEADGMYETEE